MEVGTVVSLVGGGGLVGLLALLKINESRFHIAMSSDKKWLRLGFVFYSPVDSFI